MKTYYYAHTGHRIGLDRFRRAVAILNELDEDITLLTSDYRIAQVACDFGIKKSVGLDVVRNIPQIANHGDKLYFDSDEANPIMLEDMKEFFAPFIPISNDTIAVEKKFLKKYDKSIKISYFFGDDDYEKDLERHFDFIEGLNLHLQLGFYYFLDYEEMLKNKFPQYFDFEEYDEMIQKTDILISCSPQAVLDSLATGGRPIYVQREDYTEDLNIKFKELCIPIIYNFNSSELHKILKEMNLLTYKKLKLNKTL